MRTILTSISTTVLVSAGLALAACGDDEASGGGGISVVATTTEVADLARNVVGDEGEVTQILSANADPHDYEPEPSDAEALTDADLIIRSGGDLDLWLDDIVESSGSDAPVLTLIDSVDTSEGDHEQAEEHAEEPAGEERPAGEHSEEIDPHWWQSPQNAVLAVEAIRDELDSIDGGDAEAFDANADAYIAKLEMLDTEIADCVEQVPTAQRKLVTSHDALGYYADRYGIEVIGAVIPALTTQAQASAGETAELIETIEDAGVTTIFAEAGVNASLEQTIADEAGAAVGDELWADTLGPEGSGASTYIDAMKANTDALVSGFTDGKARCRFSR